MNFMIWCVNNNCIEPNLIGRPGLVFGINRAKRSVHVTFDQLNYVVMVPENWLYKVGILCQQDRNSGIQRYLPGRLVRRGDAIEVDVIRFIAFTNHWNHELDGSFSNDRIYSATVYTEFGQIYDAQNLYNVDALGACPKKDYSKTASTPAEHIRPTCIIPEDVMKYCQNDTYFTEQLAKGIPNSIYGIHSKTLKEEIQMKTQSQSACSPIKKVIFNDPATIIFWNDGTKTVVQARGEAFDPEKGLAMAICRHYLCDICHLEKYHGLFEKHLENYQKHKTGDAKDAYDKLLSYIISANVGDIIK